MLAGFGDAMGAEASSLAQAHDRRKFGDRFRTVEHRVPDALPGRFDVLCAMDVLEHIPDDVEAMRWVAQHLLPGGIAVITVPAFQALWTEQDEAVLHVRRYTPATLARLIPPELERVHLSCFNTILFPPILAVRAAMRMRRRGERPPRSHLGVPPTIFNEPLFWLLRAERDVVTRFSLPVGVSVLLVARCPPR
jgi:SAM-dependent methyltransferase